MSNTTNSTAKKTALAARMGIGACIYPPQAMRRGLPEYARVCPPKAPVAAATSSPSSRGVLSFDFFSSAEWQGYIDAALGRGVSGASGQSGEQAAGETGEDERLDLLVQAIVDLGQEILPLLGLLRHKAENDPRLADLVKMLQDRLNMGISAACTLTRREMEVMEMAASGESNPQIARNLDLHTITVAQTLTRVYRKLDARNRSDAVRKWMLLRGRGAV